MMIFIYIFGGIIWFVLALGLIMIVGKIAFVFYPIANYFNFLKNYLVYFFVFPIYNSPTHHHTSCSCLLHLY